MTLADAPVRDAVRSVELLRLSEARLSRRRQNHCGPSENARAAMRFILERADADEDVTPSEIASHLGVSGASVTGMLDRLHAGGMVRFATNPRDRRSKLVVPFDRSTDADDIDPVTASIREFAAELSPEAAEQIAVFLDRVRQVVEDECV